jgi:N-acylneuraminate cytidylyltransferase
MNIVAIILARGGSKGVPKKNTKALMNKPLIYHTIIDAIEAPSINQIYVSTDDLEIASIAQRYGAVTIKRPDNLAEDTASSESALLHALEGIESLGTHPDLIVFLQCTSPIRTGFEIEKAIQKLKAEEADSLLSVSPSHRFLWEQVGGEAKAINYDYKHRPRRQDLNSQYVENGSIYIFKPWVLKEYSNRLGGKITLFHMSEAAALEIDSPLDFELAEFLMQKMVISYAD